MVPRKLLYSILVHQILNLDLLLVRYLTILKSDSLTLDARLCIVNLGYDQILDIFSLIGDSSEQANDLMLAKIGVNVHEHLYFKGKVYPVGLRLK